MTIASFDCFVISWDITFLSAIDGILFSEHVGEVICVVINCFVVVACCDGGAESFCNDLFLGFHSESFPCCRDGDHAFDERVVAIEK